MPSRAFVTFLALVVVAVLAWFLPLRSRFGGRSASGRELLARQQARAEAEAAQTLQPTRHQPPPTVAQPDFSRLPGVAKAAPHPTNAPPASPRARLMTTLFTAEGELPKVPADVLERWLAAGRNTPAGLLAARQTGQNAGYLEKALDQFPHDPRVLVAATALSQDAPEARRDRLDRLQAAAPDNSLADYLSARDHLKEGRPDEALKDLAAAAAKPRFDDYTLDSALAAEELYLAAGFSPAEAKAYGTSSTLLPHLALLKGLGQDLAGLEERYRTAGDPASAEKVARWGMQLGERLAGPQGAWTAIGELTGLTIEKAVLQKLDPHFTGDFVQGTAADHLAQLDARRAVLQENSRLFESWMKQAGDAEITAYFDRLKVQGESAALRWMRERLGP